MWLRASKSVLLHTSPSHLHESFTLVNKYVPVLHVHFWSNTGMCLLETADRSHLYRGLSASIFKSARGSGRVLYHTQFSSNCNTEPQSLNARDMAILQEKTRVTILDTNYNAEGKVVIDESILLRNCHSISEQILQLSRMVSLEPSTVLARYVYATHLHDDILSTIPVMKNVSVAPFGSMVNGMGSTGGDMDLSLQLPPGRKLSSLVQRFYPNRSRDDLSNQRFASFLILKKLKKYLIHIDGDSLYLPLVYNCKVPILTFEHLLLRCRCDISMADPVNLPMAYILQTLSRAFPALYPLHTALKFLLRRADVLNDVPNPFFTSFKTLTLLVVYLQTEGILPPLQLFLTNSSESLLSKHFRSIQHWFATNPHPLRLRSLQSSDVLEVLLDNVLGFLESLDPSRMELSLLSGSVMHRQSVNSDEDAFLYCANPLREDQNIFSNIHEKQWKQFQTRLSHIRNALKQNSSQHAVDSWGLLAPHHVSNKETAFNSLKHS